MIVCTTFWPPWGGDMYKDWYGDGDDMNENDLAAGFDPLDEAEGDEEPGCPQATHILPPDNHLVRNPWLEEKL